MTAREGDLRTDTGAATFRICHDDEPNLTRAVQVGLNRAMVICSHRWPLPAPDEQNSKE